MKTLTHCRRRHDRHQLPRGIEAHVEFGFPRPSGFRCTMILRDVSASGISFTLAHDLPGLEEGWNLRRARVTIGHETFNADLLVMHLTPDNTAGAVCGALVYPAEDADILAMQRIVAALEEEMVVT